LLIVPALAVAVLGLVLVFPSEVHLLLQHISNASGLAPRLAAWQTALRAIVANPLLGVGLGTGSFYIQRVAPYQMNPPVAVDHPHDSYLEFAVLAGIPLLVTFLAIVARTVRRLWSTYRQAPPPEQALLAGIMAAVVAISVNSLADAAWTLAPLAAIIWLCMGAGSSRALRRIRLRQPTAQYGASIPPSSVTQGAAIL
jgi:O-antigen ligase